MKTEVCLPTYIFNPPIHGWTSIFLNFWISRTSICKYVNIHTIHTCLQTNTLSSWIPYFQNYQDSLLPEFLIS